MSGSESRQRKVDLANTHKKRDNYRLHITTKLVKISIKQPYYIDIFIS